MQAAQLKNAQVMQQQKFEQEQTLENQKQLGKAGNEAFRSSIEKSTQAGLAGGDAGQSQGFGSTTAL
jgi:DNA-binding transcriptional regulator LsrR (DeoR family)